MKYGIELEFFVFNRKNEIITARTVTNNVDGNPLIGEIRTGIHNNIVDCIFELKKLIYNEQILIESKNCHIRFIPEVILSDEFIRECRKNKAFVNSKRLEALEEFSIYPNGAVSKVLPKGLRKASLQINFSENKIFNYTEYRRVEVEDKYRYDSSNTTKSYASLFNYMNPIFDLDQAFKKEIKDTNRVKGVYAIKEGQLGDRIEYRSLPNNVDLDKIIEVLTGKYIPEGKELKTKETCLEKIKK